MADSKLAPGFDHWLQSRLGMRLDTFVLGAAAAAISLLVVRFELLTRFYRLTRERDTSSADEWFVVAMVWASAAIIFSARRRAELRAEARIREQAEKQARALARFDPLTGLSNRRRFIEQIDAAREWRAPGRALAVLLIDLDRFKPVNDLYGHDAGDAVLVEVAKRFARLIGSCGKSAVARLGGDEFACVIEFGAKSDDPERLAQGLIQLAQMPIAASAATVNIGASVGIAIEQAPASDTAELLRRADVAMVQAKDGGSNNVRVYDEAVDAQARLATKLEAEIRRGILRAEFVPYYQPIARLADGRWTGFECLARWVHPRRGLLEPEHFIAVAEDADMIDSLSLALLNRACSDARLWPPDFCMSFNLSPIQLRNAWLPQQILRVLTNHGIAPGRLVVELTESGLFADIDVARTMINSLKNAGVRFALDDFGTGYSSLSHLAQLPFDIIKIDRSFIEGMDGEAQASIVNAIIHMGHSLGMKVTAEGVASERHWTVLKALGCDHAQGYLIGRPQSAIETLGRIAAPTSAAELRRAANQ